MPAPEIRWKERKTPIPAGPVRSAEQVGRGSPWRLSSPTQTRGTPKFISSSRLRWATCTWLPTCRPSPSRPHLAKVIGTAKRYGLPAGQGRSARCQPGIPQRIGSGNSDGVERALDDDGHGAPSKPVASLMQAEQQVALRVAEVSGLFRYLGTAGPASGRARPMKPATIPCSSRTASMTRSRK